MEDNPQKWRATKNPSTKVRKHHESTWDPTEMTKNNTGSRRSGDVHQTRQKKKTGGPQRGTLRKTIKRKM